ncbi:ABC-2 type transport system ATP-binding protein [Nakamurella sp. UYEF19]|uniref:ABC transporter ATP-binding protein n=1 Tax=Nakamurella sp. UYEF19 TaxID=1756392 RepID=UPI0033963F79
MLDFIGATKAFGTKTVLDELTMRLAPGEMLGFCGANGAGKTTTMRIALGLLRADSGEVCWQGRPVDDDIRRRIGYMPEERGLYGRMRPKDQLVYLARLSGIRPATAARRADEWIERLEVTMAPNDTLDQLSLGNQQKIQLIAAVIHDPEVLILDEPFSGLDPVATDHVAAGLAEFTRRGVGVLFSSHQLDLVERLCDRVAIISAGRLVADGRVADLRSDGLRRYEITVLRAVPGWPGRLPGVRVLADDGSRVVVELHPETSPATVLAAAQRAGEVEQFARLRQRLTDIFHQAVAA